VYDHGLTPVKVKLAVVLPPEQICELPVRLKEAVAWANSAERCSNNAIINTIDFFILFNFKLIDVYVT
jgi:hypothetical protein